MSPPTFRSPHAHRGLAGSFRHAASGLLHTVLHQRNMRIHVLAALLVGLVGGGLPLGLAEKVTLVFCVVLVFFAEMLNSALEQLVDLATSSFDERARLTKDIAAAAVLILAIGTVVIFAAILVHNALLVLAHLDAVRRQVLLGVPLVLCAGVLLADTPKPRALDAAAALAALALWAATTSSTESVVFSAMNLGLLVVCASAAWLRRASVKAA